jgi:hypothetical protein
MTDDDRFDALMNEAKSLSTDIEPECDLWPGIEAAIQEPARSSFNWRPYLAQAAAVILLVGGSSGLTWLAVKDDAMPLSPTGSTNALQLTASTASFGGQYSLGPDFLDARRSLAARLEAEMDALPPETRADVEKNLQTIRTAIEDINQALAQEPDNALLQELLLSSYREELAVMRKVNGISNAVMLREDI